MIKYLRERREKAARTVPRNEEGVPITRTTSRVASIHESLYSNRVGFLRRAARRVGLGGRVHIKPEELQRFSSYQAQNVGQTLARNPSRTAA